MTLPSFDAFVLSPPDVCSSLLNAPLPEIGFRRERSCYVLPEVMAFHCEASYQFPNLALYDAGVAFEQTQLRTSAKSRTRNPIFLSQGRFSQREQTRQDDGFHLQPGPAGVVLPTSRCDQEWSSKGAKREFAAEGGGCSPHLHAPTVFRVRL